jgi:hypothetical protein
VTLECIFSNLNFIILYNNNENCQNLQKKILFQDWGRESQEGYKKSDLAGQCTHKYNIKFTVILFEHQNINTIFVRNIVL